MLPASGLLSGDRKEMINLLPLAYRQKLREEQRFRLILLLAVILGIGLLALSIFLVLIQVSLAKERLAQESKLVSFKERSAKEDSTLKKITSWNSKLSNIASFKEERRSLKEVLDNVESALPAQLYLLSVSYTPAFETKRKARKSLGLQPPFL